MQVVVQSEVCSFAEATYAHRVDDPDAYNFCPVPNGSADAFLFAGIAAVIACLLTGHFPRLAPVFVLLAGAAAELLVFSRNLGHLGNAFTLFLGVDPPDLLLYGFLPPLLLDAALGLDWFIFKRVSHHVLIYAFLIVFLTVAVVSPLLLYGLGLGAMGWTWQHAGLFVATLASTDALAVSSIVRSAGGPEDLTVLMEGESLLNDASSLVVFTVFLSAVQGLSSGSGSGSTPAELLPGMATELFRLTLGGVVIGYVLGWVTQRLLRVLRRAGAESPYQLGLIQAMGYLIFYLANAPFGVSGVIAVVVYGLYGASTSKFELAHSGAAAAQDAVQETLGVLFNGVTFFLGGATAANFLLRATVELSSVLTRSFIAVPVIYVGMFVVRAIGVYCFNSMFSFTKKESLPPRALPFVTWGGLRGALSLIMAMVLVADHQKNVEKESFGARDPTQELITAQMVAWTSAIVLLTLCVNAPTLPWALRWCGLLEVPAPKAALLERARHSLVQRTEEAIEDLKHDEDELLRGVNWAEVRRIVHLDSLPTPSQSPSKKRVRPQLSAHPSRVSITTPFLEPLPPFPGDSEGAVLRGDSEQGISDVEEAQQRNQLRDDPPPPGYGLRERLWSVGYESVSQAELDEGLEAALTAARNAGLREQGTSPVRGSSSSGRVLHSSAPGPALGSSDGRGTMASQDLSRGSDGLDLESAPQSDIYSYRVLGSFRENEEIEEGDIERGASSRRRGGGGGSSSGAGKYRSSFNDDDESGSFFSAGASSPIDPLRPSQADLANWWETHAGITFKDSFGASSGMDQAHANEALAEARARLAGGLKRYVFARRAEGLLSPQGARLLGHACDAAIQHADRPLAIWADAKANMGGKFEVQVCAWVFHSMRRMAYALPPQIQPLALPVIKFMTSWARNYLGFAMLRSCEVALAYFMATTCANQAQWLRQVGRGGPLLDELEQEQARVSRFVVDREIEAPTHFQAIQTYRAAMAVLRRQIGFVNDMFAAGVIDELERKNMADPIAGKARAMEATGPAHSWPHAEDVIARLPFFAGAPTDFIRNTLSVGTLKEFAGGEIVWSTADEQGRGPIGLSVVVRGLVKVSVELEDGTAEERYLGSGSVLGLLSSMTSHRTTLAGSAPAVSQTSQLAKGVLVFQLPANYIQSVRQAAAVGNSAAESVLLKLHREAALQVFNALKTSAIQQIAREWEVAAIDREQKFAAAAHRAAVEAGNATTEDQAEAVKEAATRKLLLNGKELWTHAQFFAQRVVASMKRRLESASVVELGPYQRYHQSSHIVLLAGAVQYASASQKKGQAESSQPNLTVNLAMGRKVVAPAVLPLCTHLRFGTARAGQPRDLLSGHEGALLMVWPVVLPPRGDSDF